MNISRRRVLGSLAPTCLATTALVRRAEACYIYISARTGQTGCGAFGADTQFQQVAETSNCTVPAPAPPTGGLRRLDNTVTWRGCGVRFYGMNWEPFSPGERHVTSERLRSEVGTIRRLWGGNLIRLLIAPGQYRTIQPLGTFWPRVDAIIDECRSQGYFVNLCWWTVGWPGGNPEPTDWAVIPDFWDTDIGLWHQFWSEAAGRYRNRDHVMFSLWNEPTSNYNDEGPIGAGEWAQMQPYYQDVIAIVRKSGAPNLLVIAGADWSGNWSHYNDAPIVDLLDNWMADAHKYLAFISNSAAHHERNIAGLDSDLPFYCGEWGYQPVSATSPPQQHFADWLRRYAFPGGQWAGNTLWCHHKWSKPNGLSSGWPNLGETPVLSGLGAYARGNIPTSVTAPA